MRNRREKSQAAIRTDRVGRKRRMKICPECHGREGSFEASARGLGSWITCGVCDGKGKVTYKIYCQARIVIQNRGKWKERLIKRVAQTEQYRHIQSIRFADGQHFRIFRLGGG